MVRLIRQLSLSIFFSSITLTAIAAQSLPADMNGLPPQAKHIVQPTIIPSPPDLKAKAYVLMDVNSGTVIAQKNMNERLPPASLTKLMTLYLVSQALSTESVHLNDQVIISEAAWRTGGSRMFVKVGSRVPVSDLVQGASVASGNDATVALAEHVGGSTDTFVEMMNQHAKGLGMQNTHFTDPTGLPAPAHYTTAYDLGKLARAIWLNYPQYHHWYNQKWFTYNGIKQPNRNRLLWRYPYTMGMKTGHTDGAGFCLVGLAVKDNTTLIAVILNAPNDEARANDTIRLLSYGFRFYKSNLLYSAGSTITQPRVWFGQQKHIKAGTLRDVYLTAPQGSLAKTQIIITTNPALKTPITKGQTIGSVNVQLNGKVIATYPLVALEDNLRAGFFSRMFDEIAYLFHKWFGKNPQPIVIQGSSL